MNQGITIFTPTYNRAHRLPALYQSLCKQTSREFEWVVVDDGSTDDTKSLINGWIKEGKINIRYFWQENAGKAQAHNLGVEMAEKNLFTCVDSDDMLIVWAIERILAIWNEHSEKIGIICACLREDDSLLTHWDNNIKVHYCTLYDAYRKYGLKGDTMLIYQTDIIRKYKFPLLRGEKFMTEAYLYDQLDREGNLYVSKDALYIREYFPDGYTNNIKKILRDNPYGYQAYLIQRLKLDRKLKYKIIDTIQYIDNKQIIKDQRLIRDSVYPVLTCLLYVAMKVKRSIVKPKTKLC